MPEAPICDYEGSDYQSSFWDKGGREYEDGVEAVALRRLLPAQGRLLLELGAGAGRNTARYAGFEQIVLLDYSRTQLEQAQKRLGQSDRYIYVAADVNRLPFVDGLFDAATMIRVLHHMADARGALRQVRRAMCSGGIFVLEFANKRNLKSILRYWLGKQAWSPFTIEPIEFAALNFDFHPKSVMGWLQEVGFRVEKELAVSHFRVGFLKRLLPVGLLVTMDSALQWTGAFWQLTPSVFVRAEAEGEGRRRLNVPQRADEYFKCPECGSAPLEVEGRNLVCPNCRRQWTVQDGIYDFRQPAN